MLESLAFALAIVVPGTATAGPSAQPSGQPLRTIVTVKSSPYCNALVQHFNGAIVPLSGNDLTLDTVDTNLLDINDAFTHPDFARRLRKDRERILASTNQIAASLPLIYAHIMQLRQASNDTTDAQAAGKAKAAADALQAAYAKEKQLTIDLQGLAASMMDTDATLQDHPLNGTSPETNTIPKDERDIKAYLRFDGRRDLIKQSESKAVDIAYDAATTKCAEP